MNVEIIRTADGSDSLLNTDLNETYHSVHGAAQESHHVFIRNGLEYFVRQHPADPVSVLEVGFGSGLNALLALQFATEQIHAVHYTSLEPFPLPAVVWERLNYPQMLNMAEDFKKIHNAPWSEEILIRPGFTLLKHQTTLQEAALSDNAYDVVFFDAFAPGKQPGMWVIAVLEKIYRVMKRGGVFVTYCAKGQVKRDLKSLGLAVETLPGPPGKKEMTRGLKIL